MKLLFCFFLGIHVLIAMNVLFVSWAPWIRTNFQVRYGLVTLPVLIHLLLYFSGFLSKTDGNKHSKLLYVCFGIVLVVMTQYSIWKFTKIDVDREHPAYLRQLKQAEVNRMLPQ